MRSITISDTAFNQSTVASDTNIGSRPSLSYWQDSISRFQKNRRATFSGIFVLSLILFSIVGPLIWHTDPTLQDVSQISQPPWADRSVNIIQEDSANPSLLTERVDTFQFIGQPNTKVVHLKWPVADNDTSYQLYRSIVPISDDQALGLPITKLAPGENQFSDKLNLKPKTYYYSLVSFQGDNQNKSLSTISVKPSRVLFLDEAIQRGLTSKQDHNTYNSVYSLPLHPLGTDYLGRDMLARLMHGARISLFIGIVAPLLYILLGVVYGSLAGFMGGAIDQLMMRFSDFVVALPFLLFMILFKVIFGIGPGESGVLPMMIAMIILLWPATARLIRGQVLVIREEAYVNASKLLGANNIYLISRHMIPNTLGLIMVNITFAVPTAIFTEAFLSFIGMGVSPPTPSWGAMCNEGLKTMLTSPHELFFPAILISATVLSFNLLGDGLRDAFDSKLRDV